MKAIPASSPIPMAAVMFIQPPAAKKPAIIAIIISDANMAFFISNRSLRFSSTISPIVITNSVIPISLVSVFVYVNRLDMSVTFCGMTVVTFIVGLCRGVIYNTCLLTLWCYKMKLLGNSKNLRGNATLDMIFIFAMLFAFVFSAWLGFIILDEYSSSMVSMAGNATLQNNTALAMGAMNASAVAQVGRDSMLLVDYAVPTVAILLGLVLIILTFQLKVHPIFIIPSIIFIVFGMITMGVLKAVYMEVAASGTLTAVSNRFLMSYALFDNLPLVFFVISMIVLVAMLGRGKDTL